MPIVHCWKSRWIDDDHKEYCMLSDGHDAPCDYTPGDAISVHIAPARAAPQPRWPDEKDTD